MQSVVSKHQSGTDTLPTDIFTAYFCARKNKRNTASQVRFERNLSDNLVALCHDIASGEYKVGRSMCFISREPVLREVFAASFRDRIVHHLLYNWLLPVFEPMFIYDSYSCRVGKGTLFGIERLEHHIRSCSDNYKKECYVLKLDIEGYFMNINRQRLYELVVSKLCKYASCHEISFDLSTALRLISLVIFNDPVRGCYRKGNLSDWDELPHSKSLFHAPEGCGLPIGNLTSQLFSNVYLSCLDDFIKRDLKFKHYGRYVDDFYLVDNSRERLLGAIPHIRCFLANELGLKLHPRKVSLTSACQGVRFLGAVIKPYRRHISRQGLVRSHRHIAEVLTDEPNPYLISASLQSYAGYSKHFF